MFPLIFRDRRREEAGMEGESVGEKKQREKEWGEGVTERERHWLAASCTCPQTQACALTGNPTGNLLEHEQYFKPLTTHILSQVQKVNKHSITQNKQTNKHDCL